MRNGLLLRVAFCVLVPGFPASGGEAYPDTGGSADSADTDYTFLGVSALREPLPRGDEWQTYRYVPPKPDRFGFSLDGVTLGERQRTMLVEALSAVAANFPPRSQADVTVKQMALALAMRLSPTDKAPKMIDYLLRRGRQPTQVDGHERRDFVAAKLWNAGFGLGKYAETADDGSLSTLVLDVARRFDVEGTKSAATYDALRLPAASSRWNGVTDVPDVRVEEKPATPEPAIVEPAPFRFQRESASVPLFAAMQPLPQLVIEVGDWAELPVRTRRGQSQVDLGGVPEIVSRLIDARYKEWRETGKALGYTVESDASTDDLGPAAVLLADAVALGLKLDPSFALAGELSPQGEVVAAKDLHSRLGSEVTEEAAVVAVPAANVTEFADLAVMGNLDAFLARQYVAYETPDELLAIAREDRSADFAAALNSFAEIQHLTSKLRARELVHNPYVRVRLRKIVQLAPEHISAKHLLMVSMGQEADALSIGGSRDQLRRLEGEVRDLLEASLGQDTGPAPTVDDSLAELLFELRRLRPLLHSRSRNQGDRIAALVETARELAKSTTPRSRERLGELLSDMDDQNAVVLAVPPASPVD